METLCSAKQGRRGGRFHPGGGVAMDYSIVFVDSDAGPCARCDAEVWPARTPGLIEFAKRFAGEK